MHLSKRAWLSMVLVVLSGIFVFSFFHKGFNGDEAIIGEHAYWLQKEGFVRSVMAEPHQLGWEKRHYHSHKLLVLVGAAVMQVVGLSLFALRCISLGFFLTFFYFLHCYLKENPGLYGHYSFFICALILLIHSILFDFSFAYRPEVMTMTWGFMSYYFLRKGFAQSRQKFIYLSAAFAGLAAATHLNGLSFPFAGWVWLLVQKKYSASWKYALVSGLFISVYFFDITTVEAFQAFIYQITTNPVVNDKHASYSNPFAKLLGEHMRFFHSPREIVFSVLFLLSLLFHFDYFKKKEAGLLVYLLSLIISLCYLTTSYRPYYAIIYYPYMAIVITVGIERSIQTSQFKKIAMAIASLAYIGVHSTYTYTLIAHPVAVEQESEKISHYLPQKGVAVMTSPFFFFNQIGHYRIHLPDAFEWEYRDFYHQPSTRNAFFRFAKAQGDQYIIIHHRLMGAPLLNLLRCDSLAIGQRIEQYVVLKQDKDFTIFTLLP